MLVRLGNSSRESPIVDPGHKSVEVYLPGREESYTHVWTGRKYHGGQTIKVSAPYGKPPVFVVGQPKHDYLQDFLEFARKENGTVIHV